MEKITIILPKSGKGRNLASLSPLMKKGGKFASEKPRAAHRRQRKSIKLQLRQGRSDWLID
ncbi:hypothetical protein [Moraxella cuniculi]|uniref:Uncharacterized protein n=1 Tax=Moraxella cuniculi TaxID=34061 RepID=A0A448GVQ2_9GAMM|nr:hypothetical protein [Moraxella cuniculi]VEG12862.1 Uncharacterised protein [Moraxella cuniculi]